MSLDAERGIVYVPTGAAASDFYGADRHGDNLFANCLLALDANTGERKWHFQTVHHDLWDRDLPAPPNLLTVEHNGKRIDAVAQITKSAYVFLFNRETGEPLFTINETPVPASDLEGEHTSPTQPIPVKPEPFSRQQFTFSEITTLNPVAQIDVTRRWKVARKGKPFVPPSREGTIILPGFDGGGEWGGAAVDPTSGVMYVNGSEMPWILRMVDVATMGSDPELRAGTMLYARQCLQCHGVNREGNAFSMYPSLIGIADRLPREQAKKILTEGKAFMPAFAHLGEKGLSSVLDYIYTIDSIENDPAAQKETETGTHTPDYRATGYNRFVDPEGYPAIKPPWGTLNAIDMNTGTILWKSVLGDTPELRDKGYAQTGTENYGGPIVTAGGLIFIAATKDAMFHAYDQKNGKLLWETKLPQAGFATPSTYMVDGKQYVVIAASGGKIGTPAGDAYVAFRLKD
jgi:quinoprotein glucose dehydrogenase